MRILPSLGRPPHGIAGRALLLLVKRQRGHVATTDIVGPDVPLYLADAWFRDLSGRVDISNLTRRSFDMARHESTADRFRI